VESELDVTRGMYSAFARGDVASVLAALAPQIVWIEAEGFPSAGRYTTPDAVLHKVFARLAAEWEAFTVAPMSTSATCKPWLRSATTRAPARQPAKPSRHFRSRLEAARGAVVGFQQLTDTAVVQAAMR
jgi:uncharacterized protein